MKKIFSALVLLTLCGIFNFCSAQDVWFATEYDREGYKIEYYLTTQYFKEDYQKGTFDLLMKSVFHQHGIMTGRPYQFAYLNGDWYFTQTNSSSGYENVKYNEFFKKVFNACKPYVRLARDYPIY